MTYKNSDQMIPAPEELTERDTELLQFVDSSLESAASQFDQVELRAALRTAMEAAQAANKYLNATEPWKILKDDHQRGLTILFVALSAINGIRVMFSPFLPFSSQELDNLLGETHGWSREILKPGTTLTKPKPLFRKVELDESSK